MNKLPFRTLHYQIYIYFSYALTISCEIKKHDSGSSTLFHTRYNTAFTLSEAQEATGKALFALPAFLLTGAAVLLRFIG